MRKLTLRHLPERHFNEGQRMILERLWNDNVIRGRETRLSARAFAKEHGIPCETLRRELLRGMEGKPFMDKIRKEWFLPEYSAAKAQADANDKNAQKGAGQRFTNKHARALRHQIVSLKKSPAHARRDLLKEEFDHFPCVSSIYNHINAGDIGIARGQTPYKPRGKRKRKPPVRKALKGLANRSIEERPTQAAQRTQFGHWEMDTIVSCVGGRGGLLILAERMTRTIILVKLRSITARDVRSVLRKIIRSGALKNVRSITTDNGGEFLDAKAIENLFKSLNDELRLYYTHAYAAWEKGSVENCNRHVRRFFPKGTNFRRVSDDEIANAQDFINSIPRAQSLKGLSANEAFQLVS